VEKGTGGQPAVLLDPKENNEKSWYSEMELSFGAIVDYYMMPAYEVVLCTLTRIFRDKSMSIIVFVILAKHLAMALS